MAQNYKGTNGNKDANEAPIVTTDSETIRKMAMQAAYAELTKEVTRLREKRNGSVDTDGRSGNFTFNNNVKFTHFNRFRFADELDYMSTGIGYVFMTKPHLHLFNNKDIQDTFLLSIANGSSNLSKMIVENLDANAAGNNIKSKFMPIITSSAENFETKDNILKIRETGENFLGNKIVYGDVQTESLNADTFSIQYKEYSDASLLFLHKTWVDYIHAVKVNKVRPRRYSHINELSLDDALPGGEAYSDQEVGTDYVINRIIDYASSVYYFLLDPDGTTIRYWCKYTGVFPTSVPYSAMSFKLGEHSLKELNIMYQYTFKSDLDPYTLEEFAYLTSSNSHIGQQSDNAAKLDKTHDPISNNTWRKFVTISEDRRRLIFTDLIQ